MESPPTAASPPTLEPLAPAIGAVHADAAACLDCGAVRLGPYCQACGQHASAGDRLTFRGLWTDFRVRRLNLDRGFFRTVADVVRQPGAVARAFVDGRRRTYTHPIPLLFVLYAGYAVVFGLIEAPFTEMMEAQIAAQLPAGDDLPPEMELAVVVMRESMRVFYTYGAYFSLLIVLPFGWLARWLLADRGRTAAECAVFGAYIEAAVVLPSALVITPLAALTRSQAIGSLSLLLYLGFAAWGARAFFDRRPGSAGLSALAMTVALVVYFTLFLTFAFGVGLYVAFQGAHAAAG